MHYLNPHLSCESEMNDNETVKKCFTKTEQTNHHEKSPFESDTETLIHTVCYTRTKLSST